MLILVVLPLQKLIHRHQHLDYETDSDTEADRFNHNRPKSKKKEQKSSLQLLLTRLKQGDHSEKTGSQSSDPIAQLHGPAKNLVVSHKNPHANTTPPLTRTLQRYHGGPNEERINFMEKHSALASKNLGVGVEQVSIFLTSDNTVISFFESSAEDIETPIIARLSTKETILRRSSDASMLTQVYYIIPQ